MGQWALGALSGVLLLPAAARAQDPAVEAAEVVGDVFFAVTARDLEATSNWYQGIFRLDVIRSVTSEDGRGRALILKGGRVVVEIISYQGARTPQELLGREFHPFSLVTIAKVGIFVRNAERFHDRLQARGVVMDASVSHDEVLGAATLCSEIRMATEFRYSSGVRVDIASLVR